MNKKFKEYVLNFDSKCYVTIRRADPPDWGDNIIELVFKDETQDIDGQESHFFEEVEFIEFRDNINKFLENFTAYKKPLRKKREK